MDGSLRGLRTYLVGAVDLGAILQQQLHYVCVASACCPDDGVDTVLLAHRQAGRWWTEERKTFRQILQHTFAKKSK